MHASVRIAKLKPLMKPMVGGTTPPPVRQALKRWQGVHYSNRDLNCADRYKSE
uniref:Uncharacterized protein n=1 Tax=Physcomitrium patens TaxID=3218 RepID=A0A2K1KPL9_PHYPA|nr:hypothetical protein PHYPA_006626 [Physcomitrium patens]